MGTSLESAASLLTVGFAGETLDDALRGLIDCGVGGVVLFARNIASAEQVGTLIREIKTYAGRPLIVALDQEGGVVQRLRAGFTRVPPMRALGASGDPDLAFEVGRLLGRELRAVGVDLNYAPVIDVDTNPDNPVIGNRSFSHDPAVVARLGVALARGMEQEGVASCGKHFPGHGDTAQDSHTHLPTLNHNLARLETVELVPFRAWTHAGLAAIMTAHVVFGALDPDYPATMSRPVLHGLLRDRLGYAGLVISDDLEMKAIADHYGHHEAVVRGLSAGVDSFLCCHSAALAHQLVLGIGEAVDNGRIEAARFDDAVQRVRHFARQWAQPPREPDLSALRAAGSGPLVERILERSFSEEASGKDPTTVMTSEDAKA